MDQDFYSRRVVRLNTILLRQTGRWRDYHDHDEYNDPKNRTKREV